jgi:ornithine cyclodeaminase/alanine dehydrogenase-like protein (mu-crystallin family)
MTLILDEPAVGGLLSMKEVVAAVEECFARQSVSQSVNSPRTRTITPGATLNVMHGSLPYLGRSGVKCYMSTKKGTRFVLVLFSLEDGELLSVMGADTLGRYRTGAASAVATKHLFRNRSMRFSIAGSGKQALTQVLAMKEIAALETVRAWSPNRDNLTAFLARLADNGVEALPAASLGEAFHSADVGTTITSSRLPFVDAVDIGSLSHLNICGSNRPDRAEATPRAIAEFRTVVVDDLEEAKRESGDLIAAERAARLSWDSVVRLAEIVSGRIAPEPRTLFKSNGVAVEDVAVASLVYDKARRSSEYATADVEIVKEKERG